ncbi:amidohydrolase [Streptomyces sp. YC537]|uniref:Peptidase M20 domain-containing protein 2 n=1 Tax=Streptomyces boluensis TaxID=1775135 RepID=A0A964UY10_9ACTN|nr:amidohydrolase [Streptomyces boluensis]
MTAHKDAVRRRIEERRARLIALSRSIHAEPELSFEEYRSADKVIEHLSEAGFAVEKGVGGLDTAFSATLGSGDLVVGICAEYDALPEIGHACGHNVIAASAVGAALGLAAVADDLGIRVKVVGTPAEEHGGGKVLLLERGVFDDVTVSMMVHPAQEDSHPAAFRSQAVSRFAVTYTGRPSHAAAAPHLGVNAADAMVVAQVAVATLRQQITANCRIGLFVREGGTATNIIPERTVVDCEVRAFELAELTALKERVMACFQAGALASGCTMDSAPTEPDYAELWQDPALADLFAANLTATGRDVPDSQHRLTGGSTDMGNVSQVVPSIHPAIAVIGAQHAPHTRGFAQDTGTPAADDAVIDGALAMAWTAVDAAADGTLREDLAVRRRSGLTDPAAATTR